MAESAVEAQAEAGSPPRCIEHLGSSGFGRGGGFLVQRKAHSDRLWAPIHPYGGSSAGFTAVVRTYLYGSDHLLLLQDDGTRSRFVTECHTRGASLGGGASLWPGGGGYDPLFYKHHRLVDDASGSPIEDQLRAAGFQCTDPREEPHIYRLTDTDYELIAVPDGNRSATLFTPLELPETFPSVLHGLRVVGDAPPEVRPAPRTGTSLEDHGANGEARQRSWPGLRCMTPWAEFTLRSGHPYIPRDLTLIHVPGHRELHVPAVELAVPADPERILELEALNGVPIAKIEERMRSRFDLERGESLVRRIARDLEVIQAAGMSVEEVARPLRTVGGLFASGALFGLDRRARDGMTIYRGSARIRYDGERYKVSWIGGCSYGSPCDDGTWDASTIRVKRAGGPEIRLHQGFAYHAARYCIFPGTASVGGRLSPEGVISTFGPLLRRCPDIIERAARIDQRRGMATPGAQVS